MSAESETPVASPRLSSPLRLRLCCCCLKCCLKCCSAARCSPYFMLQSQSQLHLHLRAALWLISTLLSALYIYSAAALYCISLCSTVLYSASCILIIMRTRHSLCTHFCPETGRRGERHEPHAPEQSARAHLERTGGGASAARTLPDDPLELEHTYAYKYN